MDTARIAGSAAEHREVDQPSQVDASRSSHE